ncbi:MAG: MATE family multidrug resistance protein [Saprospiraceae bacterium]
MNREILRLAIPNIISNISVPLLSAVDTGLMGHVSTLHLGAIGLSTMIFNFLYWNFGFLRMGTTGMVAQAYGKNDNAAARELLFKFMMIGLTVSLGLIIFGPFLLDASNGLLSVSEEQIPLVKDYFGIIIYGAPAVLTSFCLMGWLFGMQDAFLPLVVTVTINVINILLSYYMVRYLNMGIAGVAYGTLIAQYVGLLMLLFFIVIKYKWIISGVHFPKGDWLAFARVNVDLFIRTVALTVAFSFFYRQSSSSGHLMLAANVVLLQFLSWMSYGIDGFAYAAESLVGKYKGAGNNILLRLSIKRAFQWGLVLSSVYMIIYFFGFQRIARIFSNDTGVLEIIQNYRLWIALLPIGAFVCYIWDGILIGLTATKIMRNSMLISLTLYFVTFLILRDISNNAIWISLALFLIIRGVIQSFYWIYGKIE